MEDDKSFSNNDTISIRRSKALREEALRHGVGQRPIIRRSGDCNISFNRLAKTRYLQDIYTTLVDVRWRWTLFVFFTAFIICWLVFAFIWYMIIKVHGDDIEKEVHTPCIENVKTFTACFLFSLETQHTIGYGMRVPSEECPEAVIVLCVQSITGVILQAFMVGVVFAKLTRPKKRTNTLLFSRNAVVCLRDGLLRILFRVADMRKKSFIIGVSVKAVLIRRKETEEGEVLPFHQTTINVTMEDGSQDLLFMWPITVVHTIDENSPFYCMSAVDLMNERFELVVFLEGTAESTGTSMQARYSYQPSDILWGHRFLNIVSYDIQSENYDVDFSQFNTTKEIPTPLCSAQDLQMFKQQNNNQLLCFTAPHPEHVICLNPDVFTPTVDNEEPDEDVETVPLERNKTNFEC